MNATPSDDAMKDAELDTIEMQATSWLARRDRGLTPEEAVEFARWRSADRRHEAAVTELDGLWSALDDLSALQGKNPGGKESTGETERAPIRSRSWAPWIFAAAAGLALMAGVAVWQNKPADVVASAHYETAVGDQRSIALSDGSVVRLNTDSVVEVKFAPAERRVELVRGEAQFTVAKDAARPFIVSGAGIEAQALGTVFIVRRRETATELVVTEGRVKFGAVAALTAAKEVTAGQAALCDPREPQSVRIEILDQAALVRRTAWQSGRLVCRPGMPLAELVADFNRYHRQKLVLQDAAIEAESPVGAFELKDMEKMVRNLESNFDLIVVKRDAERIILKKR